jgi:hypothetical protein
VPVYYSVLCYQPALSKLHPPRDYLKIFGSQEVSALETDDNRSATNSVGVITVSEGSVVVTPSTLNLRPDGSEQSGRCNSTADECASGYWDTPVVAYRNYTALNTATF